MEFLKFPSLVNAYKTRDIDKMAIRGINSWIVTEKVHGANMGLYCDGSTVKVASRNQFVGSFHNHERVTEAFHDDLRTIRNRLQSVGYVVLYGEYYGGEYQGAPGLDHSSKVQKGINYSNDNHFVAFSMNAVSSEDGSSWWFSSSELAVLFQMLEVSIPVAGVLFKGSLKDCLEYNNVYNSTYPAIHGMPAQEENICEGNVITPERGENFWNGEFFHGIKNKNSLWSEKAKVPRTPPKRPEELKQWLDPLMPYVTEQRFANVMSKHDEPDVKQFGRYLGDFVKDIMEEATGDGVELPEDKRDRKMINQIIGQACRDIVKKEIL